MYCTKSSYSYWKKGEFSTHHCYDNSKGGLVTAQLRVPVSYHLSHLL